MMIKLQKHKKQGSPIIPFSYGTPCPWPIIKEEIKFKLLNLEFNIKNNILWTLLSSYFVKEKMKESMTPQTPYFMFFAKSPQLNI